MMLRRRPVLVLAYHVVGEVGRRLDPDNLVVTAETLRGHIRALLKRGYRFATVSELARALAQGRSGEGLCAVTFDDGSEDGYSMIPDLLRALGVPGTLFVCPGLLGVPHPFIDSDTGIRLLRAAELRALAANDQIELGAHTMRHTVLADASEERAFEEMTLCKHALEELIGRPVTSFAYPGCAYSAGCPTAARKAGYETAVTCGRRGSLDPFELRRVSIDRLDNRLAFELKVRGLYDPLWRSGPGGLARRLARPFRHGRLSQAHGRG
jgi:peptidoglycan/xylan/chitin deacetylase (PgdA/CDA1 family)